MAIALLIATPTGWLATHRWLDRYPYRISLSWWMFAGAATIVIGIALLTVSVQSVKVALSNPVKSLRTD